ncbi:MAG: VWA domain-containing protein [Planctomycetes bacterium]|nr:VWA domain-containing protein [Planctomycetota bacterium]
MVMLTPPATTNARSKGGRLVTADGRELPLQSVHLAVEAGGGVARTVLTQRFANPYDEPLEVRYLLPLPADGAVSGFAFLLGEQRVVGEVTGRQAARERFHQAIARGQTAALLEQDRSSLFSQRVGNIPPRTEVTAEVIVDQPLRWLEEGAWEWRFPTVVAPRYQGVVGRVRDVLKLSVPVAEQPLEARASLDLAVSDRLTGQMESPSHALNVAQAAERTTAQLAAGAKLDRDLVVTWPVALPDVSASVLAARPSTAAHDGDTFALITVAPPTGGGHALPRDLTVLIDTSGSMSGRPLTQAKRVVEALVESLGIEDRLELIEFSSAPSAWKDAPTIASETNKRDALRWVRNLRAGGCTEMHTALIAALSPLRADSQRQVVLITDGLIGFEQEIVSTLLRDLPGQARVHTVGIGSGINRSLTQAAARAGRGTELLLGADENPDKLVYRLLAKTHAPLVTDLRLEGADVVGVAPRGLPDLYAESPALIAIRARAGAREVVLRGQTADGEFVQRLQLPALERGQGPDGVVALYARETVEDLETSLTAGGDKREVDAAIEAIGVGFQIASRVTSWIAVSERVTVDPGTRGRSVEQPHALPYGTSAEGLGLRQTSKRPEAFDMGPSADRLRAKKERRQSAFADKDFAEVEPVVGDEDREMGLDASREELILEDSTADTAFPSGAFSSAVGGGMPPTLDAYELHEEEGDDSAFRSGSKSFAPPPGAAASSSGFARAPRSEEPAPEPAFDDPHDGLSPSDSGAFFAAPSLPAGGAAPPASKSEFTAPDADGYDPLEDSAEEDRREGGEDRGPMRLTRTGAFLGTPPWELERRKQAAAQQAPRKKRSRWRLALLALIVIALVALAVALGLWGVGLQ